MDDVARARLARKLLLNEAFIRKVSSDANADRVDSMSRKILSLVLREFPEATWTDTVAALYVSMSMVVSAVLKGMERLSGGVVIVREDDVDAVIKYMEMFSSGVSKERD